MKTKICGKCKKEKPTSEFNKSAKKVDGFSSYCKKCNRDYLKEHYNNNLNYYKEKAKNRKIQIREDFQNYKKTLKCKKCGEDRWYVLDFHHREQNQKEFNIGLMIRDSKSFKDILEEIKKCDVLCANCHREYHYFNNLSTEV